MFHRYLAEPTRRAQEGTRGRENCLLELIGENRGCLVVNTSTELGTTEPSLVEFGNRHRELLRHGFQSALDRASSLGEFDRRQITHTANVLGSTVLGLAVMIRGGADTAEVRRHLDSAKGSLRQP